MEQKTLARKPITGLVIRVAVGELVTFGDNIKLVVIATRAKEAIITIEAPEDVHIEREFRYDKQKFKETTR